MKRSRDPRDPGNPEANTDRVRGRGIPTAVVGDCSTHPSIVDTLGHSPGETVCEATSSVSGDFEDRHPTKHLSTHNGLKLEAITRKLDKL